MNAAARLVYSSSRCGHITPLLRQLHWLKAKERIDFKFAVLVYKYMHGTAPPYLADELSRSVHSQARCRLRSASSSSSSLVVRRIRLSKIGHFRLPPHAYGTVCLSMSQLLRLSQYFVVALWLTCSLFLTLIIYVYSACEVTCHFWQLNRYSYICICIIIVIIIMIMMTKFVTHAWSMLPSNLWRGSWDTSSWKQT